MTQEKVYVTTPTGRFVMGDAFTGNDKDMQGRPKYDQSGKPKTTWFVGLAIAKNDPEWPALWQQIASVAQRDFPGGQFNSPGFAWKVIDGDGVNQNGQKYPDYCHGCYVLRMSSGFPPTVYNGLQNNTQITAPTGIKRGDYIRAYINIAGNGDMQKPGVYINHQMIQLVGYGEAITSGPSAEQAFGPAPTNLPPGASTTPVASGPMPSPGAGPVQHPIPPGALAPGVPVQPAVSAPPGPPTVPQGPTASPTNQGVQPHPTILNGPTG